MKQNSLPAYVADAREIKIGMVALPSSGRVSSPRALYLSRASYFLAWLFLGGGTGVMLGYICGELQNDK